MSGTNEINAKQDFEDMIALLEKNSNENNNIRWNIITVGEYLQLCPNPPKFYIRTPRKLKKKLKQQLK